MQDGLKKIGKGKMPRKDTYDRMLALAAHSLAKVFELANFYLVIQIYSLFWCGEFFGSNPPFLSSVLIFFFSWYLTWEQNKHEPKDLWQEPFVPASAWRPCADHRDWNPSGNYLLSLCAFVFVFSCVFDLISALTCVSACVSQVEMSWMFHIWVNSVLWWRKTGSDMVFLFRRGK